MQAEDQDDTGSDAESRRALVPIGATPARPAPGEAQRSDAGFLTQLIACRANMGPFRRYRRAEPALASQSYGRNQHVAEPAHPSRTRVIA